MASPGSMPPQPPQQAQQGQQSQQSDDALGKWRQFAQAGKSLAEEFPETTENMVKILEEIKMAMTRIAGNPQRVQPKQAPPQG